MARDQVMLDECPDAGLEIACRDQVHAAAKDSFQVGLYPAEPQQAQAGRQIREQVHIAVGAVIAAGDAADTRRQVLYPVGHRGLDQIVAAAAHPAAYWSRQPPQAPGLVSQAHHQFIHNQRADTVLAGTAAPGPGGSPCAAFVG
ncbi:MAG TPA: hypothetical protein VLW50_18330 [Streptosporangiaceae bacterium]|nr:hypothetical protein [Streptosporangiaceae bacterium]